MTAVGLDANPMHMNRFYEFFAGGGMARMGLGPNWQCLFANDFDHKKSQVYRQNWGDDGVLRTADIRKLMAGDLPGQLVFEGILIPGDFQRVRTPIGVIGMIFESRPNVTADAGALCLKSGNAALLREQSGERPPLQERHGDERDAAVLAHLSAPIAAQT